MNHYNNQHIQQQNIQLGNSQPQLQMFQQQNVQSNNFERPPFSSSCNGQKKILRLEIMQQPSFQSNFLQSQQFSSNMIQQPTILSNIQIQDPTLNYIDQQNIQPDNFQLLLTNNNFQEEEQQQFPLFNNFQQIIQIDSQVQPFITDNNFQQQQFPTPNMYVEKQQLTSNVNYQQQQYLTTNDVQQQQLPTTSNYHQQNCTSNIVDISEASSKRNTNIVATEAVATKKKGLDRSKNYKYLK